jgi:hypothetical protein
LWCAWGECRHIVGVRPFLYYAAAQAKERSRLHAWQDYIAFCVQIAPEGKVASMAWRDVINPPKCFDSTAVIDQLKRAGIVEVKNDEPIGPCGSDQR